MERERLGLRHGSDLSYAFPDAKPLALLPEMPDGGGFGRWGMKRTVLVLAAILTSAMAAHAATVINNGDETVVLAVTENGNRMDVALDPGASESICANGCFVTLPNGDRIALTGGETVEIDGGSAVIK